MNGEGGLQGGFHETLTLHKNYRVKLEILVI